MCCTFRQKYMPEHVKEHITVFHWYKGQANAPQCCVLHELPVFYIFNINRFKMYSSSA
jgi:hypothetical protein